MNRSITRLALAALAALALSLSRPAAAENYTVTDLGSLPGLPYTAVWQQTINNYGAVAVYANASADTLANTIFSGNATYVWKRGEIFPLPGLPGAVDTVAFALNDNGQAVGRSTPAGERNHAVLWGQGVLYTLGELPGDNSSAALKNNNRGQTVGYSRKPLAEGNDRHAVIWFGRKVFRLPSLPGGGTFDEALGINDKGQTVGWSGPSSGLEHAALWSASRVTDLGTLGGASSEAVAINNKGQVVGLADTFFGGTDPFLWANGVMIDLGVLPGDVGGIALAINNRGQAVGVSGVALVNGELSDVYKTHAVLWENGQVIDLQTRIQSPSNWTVTQVVGINDRGQIVGQGVLNGNLRAVLLTPIQH